MVKTKLISFEIGQGPKEEEGLMGRISKLFGGKTDNNMASLGSNEQLRKLLKNDQAGEPVTIEEWGTAGAPIAKKMLQMLAESKELEKVIKEMLPSNWRIKELKIAGSFSHYYSEPKSLTTSPDGKYLLVTDRYANLNIIELEPYLKTRIKGEEKWAYKELNAGSRYGEYVNGLGATTFSPDGKYLYINNGKHKITMVELDRFMSSRTDEERAGALRTIIVGGDGEDTYHALTGSPDGKYLYAGSYAGDIYRIDLMALLKATNEEGKNNSVETITARASGHTRETESLWVTKDGQRLVSSNRDGTIKIIDPVAILKATSKEEEKNAVITIDVNARGELNYCTVCVASPDEKALYASSESAKIKMIELETILKGANKEDPKQVIRTIDPKTKRYFVTSLALSPDQKYLFAGLADGGFKIIEIESYLKAKTPKEEAKAIRTIKAKEGGHKGRIDKLTTTPDGKYLVTGSGQLNIWEIVRED